MAILRRNRGDIEKNESQSGHKEGTIGFWLLTALLLLVMVSSVWVMATFHGYHREDAYVDKVFRQDKVVTVDITMSEKDLKALLANPMAEEMHEATVVIDGVKVEHVGVRTKGNSSLAWVARSDSDRYSLKIDFDTYIGHQNLYGLRKLNLNNQYGDPTQMREYVSLKLMEYMGVPTPAYSFMYVTVNGEEWGLYLGVENIEEPFFRRVFGDASGDLYKPEGTGSDLKWISGNIEDYPGLRLQTNIGRTDQSAMIKFLDVINHGGDLEEVMDVDEMLRYFAANTALVNLDSYQGTMKHNYYLYEKDGIFSIIPWDYNMSFGGFGAGMVGRPQGRGWRDESANWFNDANIHFSVKTPVYGTALEDRPLLNALLSVDEYRRRYEQYLEQIATEFFTEENMMRIMEPAYVLVLPYVEKDPKKFYTTQQFTEGIYGEYSLPKFAERRAESILAQLSGQLVVEAKTRSFSPKPAQAQPPQGQDGRPQIPPGMNPNPGVGAQ